MSTSSGYGKFWVLLWLLSFLQVFGCSKGTEISVGAARSHVSYLVGEVDKDIAELRKGLPEGANHLASLYRSKSPPKDDLPNVRTALDRARNQVIDLRVAKSTFFALVEPDGTVLRTDRVPDLMATKNFFTAFPATREALSGKAVETHGAMEEASAVRGRQDGQFAVAVPVTLDGQAVAVYASGWSWSAYAYRLENALRSEVRSHLKSEKDKVPLVYVYLVVESGVFGAPVSPAVSAEAIRKLEPLQKTNGSTPFSTQLEITGRDFGLAVLRAPSLGKDVAVAVLRSET